MKIELIAKNHNRFIKKISSKYEISDLEKILKEVLEGFNFSWVLVDLFNFERTLSNWSIFSLTLVKYLLNKKFKNFYNKGREIEFMGCKYLSSIGLEIVLTNYRTSKGEIDIVGFDGRSFRLIEVKSSFSFISPEEHITRSKVNKIFNVSDDLISELGCQEVGYDSLLFDRDEFVYIKDYLE
ncbi:MAG: YraN family protein [Brevinematia bacterium]